MIHNSIINEYREKEQRNSNVCVAERMSEGICILQQLWCEELIIVDVTVWLQKRESMFLLKV